MNLGNIAKIDYLMSAQRDFALRPQGADYRYILCSSPRCGSNLVGDMLYQTGLAGEPMEYLNGRYIAGYLRAKGCPEETPVDIFAYLAEMETRRSSPNGYFGLKVHFEHLLALSKRKFPAAAWLGTYDRIILLRRRDKIAQAVSLHKARVTQIWSSLDYQFLDEQDPRRQRKASFDPIRIVAALADLVQQEYGWEQFLRNLGLGFVEFYYEDLVADYMGASSRLLVTLDLPQAAARVSAPNLQRQGMAGDPMISKFKSCIGVGEPSM